MPYRPLVFGTFGSWLVAWAKLATAIVGILSFGFFVPEWDNNVLMNLLLAYCNQDKEPK